MSNRNRDKYSKEYRKERYIKEHGSIPLCACGCGNEVNILFNYTAPRTIKGHMVYGEVFLRKDFVDKIQDIRDRHQFSLKDMAKLAGTKKDNICAALFVKVKYINASTVEKILAPLIFIDIFLPNLTGDMIPKMTSVEGTKMMWENHKDMVDFEPIRQEMFKLKEELDTDWTLLAEYFDRNPRVFHWFFYDKNHKKIHKDNAKFFLKEISKIRRTPEVYRRELFARKPVENTSHIDRVKFIKMFEDYKYRYGLKSWRAVAEDLGIKNSRLQHAIYSKDKKMRASTYDEFISKLTEAIRRRDNRTRSIIGMIEYDYGISRNNDKDLDAA